MKKKEIKIDLLPEDFENNKFKDIWDCPVARAVKRNNNLLNLNVPSITEKYIYEANSMDPNFRIKKGFFEEDYDYIKQQYSKKNCNTIYQVTLIPI